MFYEDYDFLIPFDNVAYMQFFPACAKCGRQVDSAVVNLKVGGEVELVGADAVEWFKAAYRDYLNHPRIPVYSCQ
jgi:hypothetical protein